MLKIDSYSTIIFSDYPIRNSASTSMYHGSIMKAASTLNLREKPFKQFLVSYVMLPTWV